jgi:acyl-[acyl-carrier-protein]-phospholipid O-acyltransferase/long-chain-fatty-acid--[acyl-carrier-protein] ligase
LVIVLLAVTSWMFARTIPKAGAAAPDIAITQNPWTSTVALLRELRQGDPRLWGGAHIVSWFWLVGFVALSLLPALVKDSIGGSEGVVTLCLATFTVGIALGSALAAGASHGKPNLALVPLGAILIGVFSLAVGWVAVGATPGSQPIGPLGVLMSPGGLALLLSMFGLAVSGGLYIVPSFAAVQSVGAAGAPRSRNRRRQRLNAAYMVGAGAVVAGLQAAGVGLGVLFAALGVLSFGALLVVVRAWGSGLMRDMGREVLRFFFRLEVTGLENIPGPGQRVVIAPNHMSLLDGPILHSVLPKEAAFAVNTQIAENWWVKPFLRVIRAHLLDPTKPLAGARAGQRRQGRRDDRHLSGRAHHRHRQPDEGL